ncbi:MAG TPA: hypothetical protein VMB23_08340 [Spirochaetia bacterium]|nr:hypothetical protein [Spirochaetia bacterium]
MANVPLDFSFQPRRVVLLARNLVAFQWKSLVLTAGALAGTYLFFYLSTVFAGGTRNLMESLWGSIFLVTAWIAASGAFADVRRPGKAPWWFLVPASILEKFVTTVGLLLFVLVVVFPVLGFVVDLVARGISWGLWGRVHQVFHLGEPTYWWLVAVGLALAPVFLLGSVAFRRLAFLKTLLVMFLFVVALGLVIAGLGWIFFGTWGTPNSGSAYQVSIAGVDVLPVIRNWGQLGAWVCGIGFFVVVPAFFLTVAFLRLTECEVDHGVS